MILTIGVPTYNRFNEIIQFLESWLNVKTESKIELLISDNFSTAYDFNKLLNYSSHSDNIKIIQTDKNIGMTGNILNIFKHAKGDYVLISSDEDRVTSAESLNELVQVLLKSNGFYFSTPFQRNNLGTLYNYTGRNRSRRIYISEFHSSNFYLSGGVYKKIESLDILKGVYTKKENYICAHLYPHSLITAEFLINQKKCYWLNIPVLKEGVNLKPNSQMPDKRSYNHISSRYEQFVSFIDYFNNLEYPKQSLFYKNTTRIIKYHKRNLILWLRWGLATTNDELIIDFDKGLSRTKYILLKYRFKCFISPKERFLKSITNKTTRATWMLTKYGNNEK